DFRIALDITEEFSAAAKKNGAEDAQLSMSVVIVRKEFAEANPEKVAAFMSDLEASIAFANENVADAAQEIAAADYNADLHADIDALLDAFADIADHGIIQSEFLFTGKRFAAELEQNTFVLKFHSSDTSQIDTITILH
ncbi:MAG: hypothetical protein IJV58_02455, partial [Oscillospiraceae bacterium]|nr:hypothetical protein [Oscillospiraceae bacterium]